MAQGDNRIFETSGPPVPDTPRPGERPAPWRETRIVGKAVPRVDAYERVSGSAVYPSDVSLPNMLHGAILRCPHPHARVIRVDTARARRMPGVHAVIDAATPRGRSPVDLCRVGDDPPDETIRPRVPVRGRDRGRRGRRKPLPGPGRPARHRRHL